jgi:citrate lyase subunit beta/citryl-CoA lyase
MVRELAIETCVAPLFVPATRLDRLSKGTASGADSIIIDLEDAVAEKDKAAARQAVAQAELSPLPVILRVNGSAMPWCADDLLMASAKGFAAIMLPKSEEPTVMAAVNSLLNASTPIVALVETARDLANITGIAKAPGVRRIAFGSVDFSADIGCGHLPESLLHARSQIVLASRLGGLAAPVDGVTLDINDEAAVESDARRAAALGFAGKLCIHPHQILPVLRGLSPSPSEVAWAEKVLSAPHEGLSVVDQMMIDAPVRRRAEQIRRRENLLKLSNPGQAL